MFPKVSALFLMDVFTFSHSTSAPFGQGSPNTCFLSALCGSGFPLGPKRAASFRFWLSLGEGEAKLCRLNVCADVEGAEGYSGFAHGGSFRAGPDLYTHQDQGQNPAPGIGFTPGPESGPSGAPPTTNFNNIHIPPGAHAPANTPAELAPPTGTDPGGPDP